MKRCHKVKSFFYRYFFGRCSFELAQLVSLLYFCGMSNVYSYRLDDFCVTIPRCYKNVYVNSSLCGAATH